MNIPSTILTSPMADNSLSEFSQQMHQLFGFIQHRKRLRHELTNSLSKKNNLQQQTTNEDLQNTPSDTLLLQLLEALSEQLNEGHTILSVDRSLLSVEQLHLWQQQKWLTILEDNADDSVSHTDNKNIQTPLMAKTVADKVIIWLYRQWFAEHQLAEQLLAIAERPVQPWEFLDRQTTTPSENPLEKLEKLEKVSGKATTGITPNAQQQLAIQKAMQNALCIITGGPGTGKTFTVAKLVMALYGQHMQKQQQNLLLAPLSMTLTAPTGKAAQRMQESLQLSLQASLDKENHSQELQIPIDNAKTLHRLLGIGRDGMPRYHKNNPLPDDLIIVDEASMLGLELAGLLVDAIKPTARLILLGDANQLAAVEAGAVLADLCLVPALQPYRVALTESRRFDKDSAIGKLATAITLPIDSQNQQKSKLKETFALLPKFTLASPSLPKKSQKKPQTLPDVRYFPISHPADLPAVYDELANLYSPYFTLMKTWWQQTPDVYDEQVREDLFAVFDGFRILSAGHHGQLGVKNLNDIITKLYKKQLHLPFSDSHFFHGQPIMMQKNDYQLGLFNGDIGICVQQFSKDNKDNMIMGEMVVCFPDKVVAIHRISQDSYDTAFAFTIHKSQGSEYEHIAVCLDITHTRLLNQELVYTAVTRSKQRLTLFSPEVTLRTAILQKGNRQTGLSLQFDNL